MVSKMAAAFLSRQIGTNVEIGEINFNIRGTFRLNDFIIDDRQGHNMLTIDRLESRLNWINFSAQKVSVASLNMEGLDFALRKYHGRELSNLGFFLQYFLPAHADTLEKEREPWVIMVKDLQLRNMHFLYENEDRKTGGPGIDYADLELIDMDLLMNNLEVDGDTITGRIQNLAFVEKSGFELEEFSGSTRFTPLGLSVKNMKIITNNSSIDADFSFDYDNLSAFSNFITEVRFDATVRETGLEMSDIGYFAPTMFSMTDFITFKGDFRGTVANIHGKKIEAGYGNNTHFVGSISMNGLPDIYETFIHADIEQLTSSAADVRSFQLPGDAEKIPVPDLLVKMGIVNINGKFTGFYNDFVSRAVFRSRLGRLSTDIILRTLEGENVLAYEGRLEATGLNIGKLFDAQSLGKTSFVLDVDGQGVEPEKLDLKAEGTVKSLELMGYDYQNIIVDGHLESQVFEGMMSIRDENLDFTFNGLVDFNEERPRFNFQSKINHADLFNLRLTDRDSTAILSTRLDIDFQASSIDNIQGIVVFDSISYREGAQDHFLDSLTISAHASENAGTRFSLSSDWIEAEVKGDYQVSRIAPAIRQYVARYSDVLASEIGEGGGNGYQQQVDFNVLLKQPDALTGLFAPGLQISPGSHLEGKFDAEAASLEIDGRSNLLDYSGIKGYNWRMKTYSDQEQFHLLTGFSRLMFIEPSETDSARFGIDSLSVVNRLKADTLRYDVVWDDLDNTGTNTAEFEGMVSLDGTNQFTAYFSEVDLLVDSTQWRVDPDNRITYDTSGLFIREMSFYSDSSRFAINGGVSENPTDSLRLEFHELDISHLDRLLVNRDVNVDGVLSGNATLVNLFSIPNFLVDIEMNRLAFNKAELGTLQLNTSWDDEDGRLDVEMQILDHGNLGVSRILDVTGNYFPAGRRENFNFDVTLQNLGTRMFNPFVDEYIHIDRESLASGKLKVTGSYNKPVVDGKINLLRTQFLIKYLNTKYSAAGSVNFSENAINVGELNVYDTRRRSASLSGNVTHDYFRDFILDIQINHENFSALNTTARDNELFYGTAVVTGLVDIDGPLDDITMNIAARTNDGTRIMIPISSALSVSENDFIIFINNADTTEKQEQVYNVNLKGLSMTLELEVTPDADIQIFLPYGMGNIKGFGSGDINLGITPRGDFTINGDYQISDGEFFFTLENLIGREFNIREGSSISWTGSPYDATVDITATYDVKTTLAGLRLQTDSTSVYNTRLQVECIIHLQNALFNPDIRFSIDFSNVDDDTKQIIYASLDTTDQSAMSQQIVSLLVLGSFSYTTGGPNIGATGFKLLSNQLSDWLNKISKDFDIGINYQPGTKLTEDELEVALRTQLFNDRLSIDGNFGVRGTSEAQNTSNVVGDINVEYMITDDGRFRIRAFNRTNDISFLEDNAPYSQGVGVFYRKEFETFGDLFSNDKKEKKKNEKGKSRNDKAVSESAKRDEE